ncbi:hypothetical protein FRC16_002525 [Serendipita sp. 398]|nr:hypothetical protein FRC16_002525 [Serendipita sp. 398]
MADAAKSASAKKSSNSTTTTEKTLVNSYETARRYLNFKKWEGFGENEETTLYAMADFIRQTVDHYKLKNESALTLTAIAYIVEELAAEKAAKIVGTYMQQEMDKVAKSMSENLEKAVQSTKNHLDNLTLSYNALNLRTTETVDHLANTMQRAEDHIGRPKTYRDAILKQMPRQPQEPDVTEDVRILNRMEIRSRQILVKLVDDIEEEEETNPQERRKAEAELRDKVNLALNDTLKHIGIDERVLAIRVIKRNLVLAEMNTEDTTKALQEPANSKLVVMQLQTSGYQAEIMRRTYPVIGRFFTIEMNLEDENELRDFEKHNALTEQDVAEIKWIKDPSRRHRSQEVANVKIICNSPEAANKLILGPTYAHGRLVKIHKDVRYPATCAKCQHYGHFAATCKESTDTCGICANEHVTKKCPNPEKFKCTPCGANDHITNSQECPKYEEALEAIKRKAPEATKSFYPTKDRWTWDSAVPPPLSRLHNIQMREPPARTRKGHHSSTGRQNQEQDIDHNADSDDESTRATSPDILPTARRPNMTKTKQTNISAYGIIRKMPSNSQLGPRGQANSGNREPRGTQQPTSAQSMQNE